MDTILWSNSHLRLILHPTKFKAFLLLLINLTRSLSICKTKDIFHESNKSNPIQRFPTVETESSKSYLPLLFSKQAEACFVFGYSLETEKNNYNIRFDLFFIFNHNSLSSRSRSNPSVIFHRHLCNHSLQFFIT